MLINKDLCEDIFKDSIAKYASMDQPSDQLTEQTKISYKNYLVLKKNRYVT